MERKTVPLRFCKSRVPLVAFRLADEEYYAIIDTGSDLTMLDVSLKDKIKTKEIDVEMSHIGVNGGSEYQKVVQGACRVELISRANESVNVVFGGMMYDMKAISNHLESRNRERINVSALLGGDFLKHYKAKIDYKNKTLTIDEMA